MKKNTKLGGKRAGAGRRADAGRKLELEAVDRSSRKTGQSKRDAELLVALRVSGNHLLQQNWENLDLSVLKRIAREGTKSLEMELKELEAGEPAEFRDTSGRGLVTQGRRPRSQSRRVDSERTTDFDHPGALDESVITVQTLPEHLEQIRESIVVAKKAQSLRKARKRHTCKDDGADQGQMDSDQVLLGRNTALEALLERENCECLMKAQMVVWVIIGMALGPFATRSKAIDPKLC